MLSQQAIDILLRVKDHIREDYRRFTMEEGVLNLNKFEFDFNATRLDRCLDLRENGPPCGTAACIAGWVNLLVDGANSKAVKKQSYIKGASNWYEISFRAEQILGINDEVSASLFHVSDWPVDLREAYHLAADSKDRQKMATLACQRIDRFIVENRDPDRFTNLETTT